MSASVEIANHIREVQQVVDGAEKNERESVITDSWRRCIDEYHLDPVEQKQAYILPHGELRQHQERLDKLIRTARFGLEELYRQVASHHYVVLLTDSDGVTVDFLGDPAVDHELRKSGLYLGSEWSEARAGTCGVGSCIYTGEALTVHQSDHFDATHTPLTCTAAPIFDVDGSLAAVLDISALHSPEPKASQAMTLQLLQHCTRRVEMANLMNSFRHQWIVRLSRSPAFVDVDPECALALNHSGQILGMTHSAQQVLAAIAGIKWQQGTGILGALFSKFFEIDINDLPTFSRALPTEERLISAINGDLWFAHAVAPQKVTIRRRVPAISAALAALYDRDPVMEAMATKASRLATSDLPLLITGETGSGKEYLAKAVHLTSQRRGHFVAINCAAIPETLIESELFGYVDGAFTGARSKGKKGLIEQSDGGTLFLDEIGDMPLALQARLLRVLAENEVIPVGGTQPVSVSLRIVAATHQDLSERVSVGKFRQDLYYRIGGGILNVPPLRQRNDVIWLAEKLLNANNSNDEADLHLNDSVVRHLTSYHWPGNIRELANAMAFARAYGRGPVVEQNTYPNNFTKRKTVIPCRKKKHQILLRRWKRANGIFLRQLAI
ncbi:sigma-54-dependent Fis family transcriptional regulator [Veronia pacifica]|uniref:sigma-54-dependent Fis family transcriptional regulator n=1 Tax=Veronia pacifica TaxID=1080227 RepID=UPI000AC2DAC3|nr:sigma-54-dependent Fis family transcriptional regulator [Veronia pacifica]